MPLILKTCLLWPLLHYMDFCHFCITLATQQTKPVSPVLIWQMNFKKKRKSGDKKTSLQTLGEKQLLTGLRTLDLNLGCCQKKCVETTATFSLFFRCWNMALTFQSRLPSSHYLFCLCHQFMCNLWLLMQCFKLLAFSVLVSE